jgi:hypothetical protein
LHSEWKPLPSLGLMMASRAGRELFKRLTTSSYKRLVLLTFVSPHFKSEEVNMSRSYGKRPGISAGAP